MSLRSKSGQRPSFQSPITSNRNMSRLKTVLSTGMMHHEMYHHYHSVRKVLMIKGIVFGLPDHKIEEAYQKAKELIESKEITTIVWDGDKMQYPNQKGEFQGSFTAVIDRLMKSHPNKEFIYFKKRKDVFDLISGHGAVEADGFGGYLGPFKHLTEFNTAVLDGDLKQEPGRLVAGKNYAVMFEKTWDRKSFYFLGLKGLHYIKSVLGVNEVDYLVVSKAKGGAVEKEMEMIEKDRFMYPHIREEVVEYARQM